MTLGSLTGAKERPDDVVTEPQNQNITLTPEIAFSSFCLPIGDRSITLTMR